PPCADGRPPGCGAGFVSGPKHTRGPWRACKDGACVCGHIWAEGDKRVATVHENTRDGDGTVHAEWSREERVANARLIAAAPHLAAELAAWQQWAERWGRDIETSVSVSPITYNELVERLAATNAALRE